VYDAFVQKYTALNAKLGLKQYLVPYLMSSHPGCTLKDAVLLAEYLRDTGHQPEQVQDFYPTPGTLSTCMYYTGLDPRTMQPVYVPKTMHEKAMQRALMQWRNPKNRDLIREALRLAGREVLIGFGRDCLVPPRDPRYDAPYRPGMRGADPRPTPARAGKKSVSGSRGTRSRNESPSAVSSGDYAHTEKRDDRNARGRDHLASGQRSTMRTGTARSAAGSDRRYAEPRASAPQGSSSGNRRTQTTPARTPSGKGNRGRR
jgi:hypothetical protein